MDAPAFVAELLIIRLDDDLHIEVLRRPEPVQPTGKAVAVAADSSAAPQLTCVCVIDQLRAAKDPAQRVDDLVNKVIDSSRYFVLRVVPPKDAQSGKVATRRAFLGVGFRERSTAMDFRAALDDHLRLVRRQSSASEHTTPSDSGFELSKVECAAHSLRDGEKVRPRLAQTARCTGCDAHAVVFVPADTHEHQGNRQSEARSRVEERWGRGIPVYAA